MKLIIFLHLIVLAKTNGEAYDKNYKHYEILPLNEVHIQLLQNIKNIHKSVNKLKNRKLQWLKKL